MESMSNQDEREKEKENSREVKSRIVSRHVSMSNQDEREKEKENSREVKIRQVSRHVAPWMLNTAASLAAKRQPDGSKSDWLTAANLAARRQPTWQPDGSQRQPLR